MNLRSIINARMTGGGKCPASGSLGECPAMWLDYDDSAGNLHYTAALYLWKAAGDPSATEVASWFKAAGCRDLIVSATLLDEWNHVVDGKAEDGARPWLVQFELSKEQAKAVGLWPWVGDGDML